MIVATWEVENRNGQFYVIEKVGLFHSEYGPMTPEYINPLLAELEDIVKRACLRELERQRLQARQR